MEDCVISNFFKSLSHAIKLLFFIEFLFILDKPKRPPPPGRPPTGPHIQKVPSPNLNEDEDEFNLDEGDDPFDTTYVEKIVPKPIEYDEDFDPRGIEEEVKFTEELATSITVEKEVDLFATPNIETAPEVDTNQLTVLKKDLLSGSTTDLSNLTDVVEPIAPSAQDEEESFIDPFDTSAVENIVAPGKAELKFLEKEFLESDLKKSLSDPDFDPRADEEEVIQKPPELNLNQRKASLNLNIYSGAPKIVTFVSPDLLHTDSEASGKIQKPLTPYYNRNSSLGSNEPTEEEEEDQDIDPFDTSFVPQIAPTKVELDLLEKEILKEPTPTLTHSLSDPDFDPRAITPISVGPSSIPESKPIETDLFLAVDDHEFKVLTPAKEDNLSDQQFEDIDPFDTSIAANIKPGSVELKLLEDEFIEKKIEKVPDLASLDILSDTQDNSLYIKLLTPQKSGSLEADQPEDFDPFDTSFAANIAPGEAEIKLLESELIN
jgi:hypothetical protein